MTLLENFTDEKNGEKPDFILRDLKFSSFLVPAV